MNNKKTMSIVEAADLYKIKIPLQPQLNKIGDKALYICKSVDKLKNTYQTRLHLLDIKRKIDSEYTRGHKDSNASWHPNGKKIIYLNNDNDDNILRSISIYGGESQDIHVLGRGRVESLRYSPDGKWISYLMQREDKGEGHPSTTLRELGKGEGGKKDESEEPLVREIDRLFYRLDGEGWESQEKLRLYILRVGAKTPQCIIRNDKSPIASYNWSNDSKRIAYRCNIQDNPDKHLSSDSILVYSIEEKMTTEIPKKEGPVEQLLFDEKGEKLYFIGHFYPDDGWGAKNMELWECDLSDGTLRNLSHELDRTLSTVSLGDITPSFIEQIPAIDADGNIYFTVSSEGGNPLYSVNVNTGEMESLLEGPEVIVEYHKAADENCFILHLAQMERPDELWFLDLCGEKTLSKLTRLNDKYVEETEFNHPEEHNIPVEGAIIQTWIIKPPYYKEGIKYPMLLQIHGGPRGQYGYTWFHEMQVLAAQGYIVVYANPQGSQGYGHEFAQAIQGKWAEPAFSDLMSITDYMIESGVIDESKLFVTGGSYGGYMTNWIVAHTNRFKAAVTQRSVTNLETFFACSDIGWDLKNEFDGAPWENPDAYKKWSPITYAEDIDTPLLIIHSENDLRCPMEQAEQLYVRLKYEDKKVKFLRYPEESHGLSRGGRPDRRIHRLNALIEWFDFFL